MSRFSEASEYIIRKLEVGLDANLTYHSVRHTKDVMVSAEILGNSVNLSEHDLGLLVVASAYHDSGFLRTYKDHEEVGCEIVNEALPGMGFSQDEIDEICKMIMATKIPQSANSELERIICDADLDYLGRQDFEPISNMLYQEFLHFGVVSSFDEWMKIQISFIGNHQYWTESAIETREPLKQAHLQNLKKTYSV